MSDNQEYILSEHDLLMSYTDTKGIITFVNDDLLRITGYSKEELIGSSHNLLRHPDVPKKIYEDLWKTLSQKRTWTGLIKNKTKNGNFFWVRANVTPIYQKDRIIGYMAVHRAPNPESVKRITPVYAEMNAGVFNYSTFNGYVEKNNFFNKLKREFANIKIRYKLFFLALFTIFSLVSFSGMNYLNSNALDVTYHHTIQDFKSTSKAIAMARQSRFDFKSSMQEWQNILLRGQNTSDFAKYKTAFESQYQKTIQDLEQLKILLIEQKKPIAQVEHLLTDRNENLIKYREALKQYQNDDASMHLTDDIIKNVSDDETEDFNLLIESLEKELENTISHSEMTSDFVMHSYRVYLVSGLLLILSLITISFWFILQDILKPLSYAKEIIRKISQGHYLQPIDTCLYNEVGDMLDVMKAMSVRLASVIDMEKKASNEHLSVLIGLDNVTTGVLITDTSRKIIYANKAAQNLLRESESDLCKDLPHFRADKVVGQQIDLFHKNPAHQIALLESLTETTEVNISIGGRYINLTVSPIVNQFGHRLGDVVEWNDNTAQTHIENEISVIVNEAINGRFNNRFKSEDKQGFYKILTDDLNRLLEVCESGFDDFKRVFSNMVQGDLTEKIERQYRGDFDVLTQDANLAVLQLNTVVFDLNSAIENVNQNIQEINEGNNHLASRTQTQTENLKYTVDSISELKIAVQQNDDAAEKANNAINRVFEVANKGVNVIHNVVDTMEEIHQSSLKIVDIIAVIDGIAFQTNILALNAAVEAARAGEQGRGFAVVAGEVRNLAQRAASAASEIKGLITDSEEKVEDGSRFVIDAGKIMQEIATSIEGVTDMMSKIAQSCSEQSVAIEQVNSAITETENIVKQNAELVIQAANASSSLEDEMKSLSEKTAYFKVQKNSVDFQLF
ncbi:MAG: methyl-accepting chemotaxis protein [Methylococcaceae bacterium]